MKKFSYIFWGLAALLFIVMCVVVIFNYREMKIGIEFKGYSAPAEVAFLYAIPFSIAIFICVIIGLVIWKKR